METEAIGWPEGTAHERKGPSRPVDLVHLSRYTLGERALEREALELFCTQSTIHIGGLRAVRPAVEGCRPSLKGSAQAIGASRIPKAAERAESLSGAFEARGARLHELESSVHGAKAL